MIVGVGGQPVKGQAAFYTQLWSRGAAGIEVPLDVMREGRIQQVKVQSINRETYYRRKPTY